MCMNTQTSRTFATFLLICTMPLSLSSADAISSMPASKRGLAVLPAAGVWLRLPVIPWPNWKPGHRGLDIQTPVDTEILSPAKGVVSWVGRIGKTIGITINAGSGIKHTITGVDSSLAIGQNVWQGEFIGWSITNQHCENLDCIHWSTRQNGRYIDPRWLLEPLIYRLPKRVDGLADTRF